MTPAGIATTQYVKLEQRLLLLAWLNGLLGYKSNRELLTDMKNPQEGFDASGLSYIYYLLEAYGDKVKIPLADLARYDDHIREHLQAMNSRRSEPITLRYFQYMAVLFTEIMMDWYFRRRGKLLRALNKFVQERNAARAPSDPVDVEFSPRDLTKLAFWMATGSGKTLIMHINYRQFLHYNDKPLDNILLITPNEGLSEQHMNEMTYSSIPCHRFDLNESDLGFGEKDLIRVIEITKLVEEKRGGGVSVPIEAFEGNNLIFVDEGHKGSGGEVWRNFRDALGETGFTFEYSATFGQALTAARNDELTAEYGKAIVFDYSYRYFHGDGYGKDFRILNLKEETTEDKTETLLLGNLLSFCEQQRVFNERGDTLRPYNLEKPLWVFVGSSVNAVYSENRQKRSDVLTIARFLHHLLENKRGRVVKTIKKLLEGKSGIVSPDGQDLFAGKFEYLRKSNLRAEDAYQDILVQVLHAPTGGRLHLCDMRGYPGELGLKASGAHDYFGLIYIGDTSTFKKLVEEDDSGIVLEEDAISGSLFEGIGDPDTSINVLIGAKKFMEGWNSWRVSNMGLLNIGRKEGSEIIQLFGRGVRLKGKNLTLKRSSVLDNSHPEHIGLLETLNIFAIRANYMAQFREYLEKEGVETEGDVVLPLAIEPNKDFLDKGLVVPRVPENRNFAEETHFLLEADPSLCVRVDMSLKIQALESGKEGVTEITAHTGRERHIPSESLDFVDWEAIYLNLLEYKERKGLVNLVISQDAPRKILATTDPTRLYSLVADESVVKPSFFVDTFILREAVLSILRKYVDKFYYAAQRAWEMGIMEYKRVNSEDPNFQDYTVHISRSQVSLIAAIEALIEEGERLYQDVKTELPTIHFDRHLYQPLLIKDQKGLITSTPVGLEPSESQFVEDLRAYWQSCGGNVHKGQEVFLLRNLSQGRGVSFFSRIQFYPDFILWIKDKGNQRIVFIEPHGMTYEGTYEHDPKAQLHEHLKGLSKKIRERTRLKNVSLDSFIVSATSYENLWKKYGGGVWDKNRFAESHILFPERNEEYDYLATIMRKEEA